MERDENNTNMGREKGMWKFMDRDGEIEIKKNFRKDRKLILHEGTIF